MLVVVTFILTPQQTFIITRPPDSHTFHLYRESGFAPLTSIDFLEGG